MMTEQDFDTNLARIEEQTAIRQERVDGYRDQQLAKLFVESEWSQEQLAAHLAAKWEKSVSGDWVSKHLRFGRFLSFFNTGCIKDEHSLPSNLTEGRFRTIWDETKGDEDFRGHKAKTTNAKKDEERRFGEVMQKLQLPRKRKPIQNAIVKHLKNRTEFTSIEEIARRASAEFDSPVSLHDVSQCLRRFTASEKHPYRVEKTGEGANTKFRLVRLKGKIADRKHVARWAHDLVPMLETLIAEAQKDRVEISTVVLCNLASKIKQVLESVTAVVPADESVDQEA